MILASVILLGSLILGVTTAYSIALGITPTPTSTAVREKLQEVLPAQTDGTIYELGSGWGTLLAPLAKYFPSAQIVGYELSPLPLLISKLRRAPASLKLRNFFKVPLDDAGLIICYLFPGAMHKLEKKFSEELRPGAIVISHTFALSGRTPERVVHASDLYRTPIYLYRF